MDIKQVTETIAMIEEQNFDVRTITMGISLLDCIDSDIDKAAEKVYNKIVSKAKDLVTVGDEIAAELGIPIVNKRVSVTPISIIGAATDATDYVPFAKALDRAAKEIVTWDVSSKRLLRQIQWVQVNWLSLPMRLKIIHLWQVPSTVLVRLML